MNVKSSVPLKHKLFHPCKKMVQQYFTKLRFRKPLFIRGLVRRFRRQSKGESKKLKKRKGFLSVSFSHCFSKKETDDRVMALKSFSDADYYNKAPFPSPLTPAYVRMNNRREGVAAAGRQEVEDACRCFENYLMEMIMEEGKTRDLMDVEELLHCWKNLKSPVFNDLVCRFYAELCRDLFSNSNSSS